MSRAPGTRVSTTQGPAIEGIVVQWAAIPRPHGHKAPVTIDPTRFVEPPGCAIVLLVTGEVALCMTGAWRDVYARSVVADGIDPLDAFMRLCLKTTLIHTLHNAACWDKFEIAARINQLWKLEKS